MTSEALNTRRRTLIIVPLSTSARVAPPLTVQVECAGREAAAAIDQVRAVSHKRLLRRIGTLTVTQMERIRAALHEILELD